MSIYSDMSPFLKISNSGAVETVYDADVVVRSIKNIFATVSGERVRNPIGSRILRLLFQRMDADLARQIRNELAGAITRFEPRVEIINFTLTPNFDQNSYDASLLIKIKEIPNPQLVETRLRSFSGNI